MQIIKNTGIDNLTIDNLESGPAIYSTDLTNFTVTPGGSQIIEVTYAPTTAATHAGSIKFNTNDPFFPRITVDLIGEGVDSRVTGPYYPDPYTLSLFNFDDGSGDILGDSSGLDLHGILHGNPAWSTAGRYGNSLVMDGVNDWIEIPGPPSLDQITADFTIEIWFLISQRPDEKFILLGRDSGDSSRIELTVDENNGVAAGIWDSTGTQITLTTGSPGSFNLDQWYHIAFSWDGDSLRLSLNNIIRSTKFWHGSLNFSVSQPFYLGGNTKQGFYLNGMLDDLRMSSIARKRWESHVLDRQIYIAPTNLDFSTVLVEQNRTLQFGITNLGDQDLVITDISGGGEVFSVPDSLTYFILTRFKTKAIPVTFIPKEADISNFDSLLIKSNDRDITVKLNGSSTDAKKMKQ